LWRGEFLSRVYTGICPVSLSSPSLKQEAHDL
jgi:hypothetical protein